MWKWSTHALVPRPRQMTRLAMAAAVCLCALPLLRSESVLGLTALPMRPQVTAVDGFDDGCAPNPWGDVRTTAVCSTVVMPIGPTWMHSAGTATDGSVEDAAWTPPMVAPPASAWPEAPFAVTDALRPEPVGRSHRRGHRGRRRAKESDVEPPTWLGAAALGLVAALHPVANWAWASAMGSVVMLVVDQHFWWPVCAALSLNYWCAAAWIAVAVSWGIGWALAVVAFGMRGSALLFMDTGNGCCFNYRAP
jgi:hypothetical protein